MKWRQLLDDFMEKHWVIYVTVMALMMIAIAHMGWVVIVGSNQ